VAGGDDAARLSGQPFELAAPGGSPRGHRGGSGPPAPLLHGGAAAPDHLDALAAELALVSELQDHCKRVTAPYKYPREIEFLAELPKTRSGKSRRVELRKLEEETGG
jgi:acyl-CoA synthetase (AMP-forming)/AMP-acid ligase II